MKASKWTLASAIFCLYASSAFANSGDVSISHYESLQSLSIESANSEGNQKLSAGGNVTMKFDAMGQRFDLELKPNSSMFSNDVLASLSSDVGVYRGNLAGNPDSWVRIVVADGQPRGLIWDGSEMFAVEAAGDNAIGAGSTIIYRANDMLIQQGSMTCSAHSHTDKGGNVVQKLTGELEDVVSRAPGAVEEITVGLVGDFEFFNMHGEDSAADIVARMNNVDGIFSQELGVQITVPIVDVYTDIVDPFTDESDPGELLDEVAVYRQARAEQTALGLTHLYTGRDLDGTTAGVAYNGVLCESTFGVGLSEGDAGLLVDSLIAAHELGHNFGAPHDGQEGSACAAEPLSFIMAPTINPNTSGFSDCTKVEVADDIARASCVVALPTVDMEIDGDAVPTNPLFGATESFEFEVRNNGLNTATNVDVEITLPNTLTFDSVTPSEGVCVDGAGVVNCDFGNFSGQSSETITIDAVASTIGGGDMTATITTDVDERPSNNAQIIALTVEPAVDLVVTSAPASSVQLDSSMMVTALMENRATLDATNSTISLTLGSGLRADSATWSIGNCNVTGQQVDCQATNFANGASATLNVGITGISAGRHSYSFTLGADEADTDPVNNTVSGTIRVNDPNAEDSGSGSIGLPMLLLLSAGAVVRRRRQRS